MKRMICTALTALLLIGAPMAVFAQAEGGAPAAEAAPKKQHKEMKKTKKHHKKTKSAKGKTKEKPAAAGSEMK